MERRFRRTRFTKEYLRATGGLDDVPPVGGLIHPMTAAAPFDGSPREEGVLFNSNWHVKWQTQLIREVISK